MAEVFGIDVSHHNGNIDWARVAASGKKFAIMKAQYEAQSHRIDETFEYNYAEAGKHGLARGVYIYLARASLSDPVGDANALVSKLKGRPLEYGIWLDLEDKNIKHLRKAEFNELIDIYTVIFRAAGYYVGIYCNRDWYLNVLDSAKLKKEFTFWIARYPKNDKGTYNPNSSLKPDPKDAAAWQYSSKGAVPGIKGNVDLNVDFDGVVNLMQKPAPAKVEEKPEVKAVELPFKVGQNYKLNCNLFVRNAPNGLKIAYQELTANAKANGYPADDGSAVLRARTVVTCKEVEQVGKSVWIKIPSGWICGIAANGTKYVS